MRLFNEQRAIEQSIEHHLGVVLPSKTRDQAISGLEKQVVMVEHPCIPSVVNGTDAPNGVEGVLNHQRLALFRDLLV